MQGAGCRVQGAGCRVQGAGLKIIRRIQELMLSGFRGLEHRATLLALCSQENAHPPRTPIGP